MGFPVSVDVITNPAASDKLNSPSHSALHTLENAIITALANKIGTTASTPTAGTVLHGTGVGTSAWAQVDPTVDIAAMSSATLRSILTDETGTGFAMFSTAPSFTNPTITGGGTWTDGELIGGVIESNVFHDASALPKAVSLPANRAFILLDRLEVSASFSLTIPATSTIEVAAYGRVSDVNAANSFLANNQHNMIINGRCGVAQRAAPSLTGSFAYGQVDRFAAKADGTIGAGTVTQSTSPNVGSTGYSLKLSGVTLSGALGVVYIRYRMEAKDALAFKNQAASFACRVYHDVGSTQPFKITIRKPTVADTFTTTNDIATKTVNVATATATRITFENIANGNIGDVSNGLEIEIAVAAGAITTKNFEFTEFVMNIGATANSFYPQTYQQDLSDCQRYFIKIREATQSYSHFAVGFVTGVTFTVVTPVPLRTTPTLTFTNAGHRFGGADFTFSGPVVNSIGSHGVMITATSSGAPGNGNVTGIWTNLGDVWFDSEL